MSIPPRPWRACLHGLRTTTIDDAEGHTVAFEVRSVEVRALIIRLVNVETEIVAALEAALAELDLYGGSYGRGDDAVHDARKHVEAALAKVRP